MAVAAITNCVAVPDEVESGAGAQLDEMQRFAGFLRERAKPRMQYGRAADFVGVRYARAHERRQLLAVCRNKIFECRKGRVEIARALSAIEIGIEAPQRMFCTSQEQEMNRRKQDVGRRLPRTRFVRERLQLVVLGHAPCELLVERGRVAPRFGDEKVPVVEARFAHSESRNRPILENTEKEDSSDSVCVSGRALRPRTQRRVREPLRHLVHCIGRGDAVCV